MNFLVEEISGYAGSPGLFVEENFMLRSEALDAIRIFLDNIPGAPQDSDLQDAVIQARHLKEKILRFNISVAQTYRDLIMKGYPSEELRERLNKFTRYRKGVKLTASYGPENLDHLINAITEYDVDSIRLPKREKEMIHLEVTPLAVVIELADILHPLPADLFYDLGSGLGHALMVYNLLTGLPAVGIEIEPYYCELSAASVSSLHLKGISIRNENVLDSTMDDGTIFFLFSPFTGGLLEQVLDKLKQLSERRSITICSYGPLTKTLVNHSWMKIMDERMADPFRLAVFHSVK